jgi:UDP-2,3-diacylglucosamine pyrophosphatase LpxH
MTLLDQVKQSLNWKKSNYHCASKLGITVEKYKELKRQLKVFDIEDHPVKNKVVEFKEDLANGTAEIKGLFSTEPRSSEEIIKLLKIDTNKWKLSSYWNKERGDGWFISAMVVAIKPEPKDILAEVLANFKPEYQHITDIFVNDKFNRDCVGIISTQDLHFGKEDNEDIVEHFKEAIESLVHRAYMSSKLNKIIYVIGGDLLNMDTFSGSTTSGTPVDNSMRAQQAYKEAFDALFWSINYIKQFCDNLHVVYVPGNHDRLSSYHIAHALSKCFDPEDYSIYFDVEYAERKVVVYGNNFFAFEHGDVTKKNTALVYATEFPLCWGRTTYRTCYTGHFHSKKTIEYTTENEYNGFSIKHLPSLCSTDYWHYHNKYTGSKRQAIMEIHDLDKGKISEFTYTV